MSRHQKYAIPGITLFPFMSILACLIGSLVMIIVGLTLVQVNASFNIPLLREYEELLEKIEKLEPEIKKVDNEIDSTEFNTDLQRRLKDARTELKYLKYREDEAIKALKDAEAVATGKQSTPETLSELEVRFEHLKKELSGLAEKIDKQGEKLTGSTLMLTKSFGSGEGYRAAFIECSGSKVILHPDKTKIISQNNLEDSEFITYLKRIKEGKRVAVFLIREDGVKTFEAARKVAEKHCDKIGFLPLPGNGPIDFSTFKEN